MKRRTFDHDAVLHLYRLGHGPTEIARCLGVPRSSIKSVIQRSREMHPPGSTRGVSIYTPWPSKCNPALGTPIVERAKPYWSRVDR